MQSYPSWKEFQRLANMTSAEAQAVDALLNAAQPEYRLTRSYAVTLPLVNLTPADTVDLGELSLEEWIAQLLRKTWVVNMSQGDTHRTISLILGDWYIDGDAQEVHVRCSTLAMELFSGNTPDVV